MLRNGLLFDYINVNDYKGYDTGDDYLMDSDDSDEDEIFLPSKKKSSNGSGRRRGLNKYE